MQSPSVSTVLSERSLILPPTSPTRQEEDTVVTIAGRHTLHVGKSREPAHRYAPLLGGEQ